MQNTITKPGRILSDKLFPSNHPELHLAQSPEVDRVCSLIMRHSVTHNRLQEMKCNGTDWQKWDTSESFAKRQEALAAWIEKRETNIERRITELCKELPTINGKAIVPLFSGDPRGCTVKLIMPDGRYDDWGQEGICTCI